MANNKSSEGAGPTQRQLQVGENVRRTLAEVLMRGDTHDADLARMSVTVGEVRMSTDLKIATAYVMSLGGRGQDELVGLLARNKHELRRAVAKKLGLKFAPDLRFRLDTTFDQMDETRRLFAQGEVQRDLED